MEIVARTAFWNKAVAFYSASGGFSPAHCPKSNDTVPWISERWSPELEPSLAGKEHKPNQTDVRAFRDLTDAFYNDGNSVSRFTDPLGDGYKGTGPHGYSIWASSKSLCRDDKVNSTKKGCSAMEVMGECIGSTRGNRWMSKEASVYSRGSGASHHPTAGMHLIRGEFIAYNYLHILLDAIYMLEEDLKTKTKEELKKVYQTALDKLQGDESSIPKVGHCGRRRSDA